MNREILIKIISRHAPLETEYSGRVTCGCTGLSYEDACAWAEHVTDAIYPR